MIVFEKGVRVFAALGRSAPWLAGAVVWTLAGPLHARADDVSPAPRHVTIASPEPTPNVARVMCPSTGSVGTAFKHRSGLFLASDSIVSPCSDVFVLLPSGVRVDAHVMARDSFADLVLLKPSGAVQGEALDFAEQADLRVGTPTASLGYPSGYNGNAVLMTIGYVAGIQRLQVAADRQITKLLIGATYNSGLSGSPLLDKSGAVVGVISGKLSSLSDTAVSALQALKNEPGSTFLLQQPDGRTLSLSHGQVVAMLMEEMERRMQYIVGVATPLDELRDFISRNGVEP